MQGRALGCLGPGPSPLRRRAPSSIVPLRCPAPRPSFCSSARQAKKKSGKAPRAEQATSTATTEQEQQQHNAESNGNGSAPTEVKLTENISHGLKSDLEVDSVLAKEMGENGECCGFDLPACFNTGLLTSAYSFPALNQRCLL